jgi:hypothetical protein
VFAGTTIRRRRKPNSKAVGLARTLSRSDRDHSNAMQGLKASVQRLACSKVMRKTAELLGSLAVSAGKRLTFRLLRVFSEQRNVLGIEVWMMANTEAADEVFGSLQGALSLLHDTDHLRFGRAQRHVKRIVVADNTGAVYVPEIKACVLGLSYVLESSPARLASAIVHEATHARMRNMRVAYTPKSCGREETRCVSESLAFLDRVPGGEREAAQLRESVGAEMQSDEPWFAESRRWKLFADDMRRAGYPEWFIRLRGSV